MSTSLYYPHTGTATTNITLKNPSYGDSDQYNNNILYHMSMSGAISSYKKLKNEKLLLRYSGLTKTELDSIINFYILYSGSEFGYTDNLSRKWRATFITNPLESSCSSGYSDCELYNVTLQLAAIPLPLDTIYLKNSGNFLVDNNGNSLII